MTPAFPFLLLLLGYGRVAMVMTSSTCQAPGTFTFATSLVFKDVIVNEGYLFDLNVSSRLDCIQTCSRHPDCQALCWVPGHTKNCQLRCRIMTIPSGCEQPWPGASYLYRSNGSQPAESGSVSSSNTLFACQQHYDAGRRQSGVYNISLPDGHPSFHAFCDMDADGGGWTVFLNRASEEGNFDATWCESEAGFGNLQGNYWLGLTYIHRLTKAGLTTLRVDVMDWSNNTRYAKYSSFTVAGACDLYRMRMSNYTGNLAGFDYNSNAVWVTKDRDQTKRSCTTGAEGPWWYHGCTYVRPMSPYAVGGTCAVTYRCMAWHQWHGPGYSLKSFRIMVR